MTVFLPYLNLLPSMSPLFKFYFHILFTKWRGKKCLHLYPLELLIQAVKYLYKTVSEANLKDKRKKTFWSNLLLQQHFSPISFSPSPLSHSPPSTRHSHSSPHSPQCAPISLSWKTFHRSFLLPAGSRFGQFNRRLAKPSTSPLWSPHIHRSVLHCSIINVQELLW